MISDCKKTLQSNQEVTQSMSFINRLIVQQVCVGLASYYNQVPQ